MLTLEKIKHAQEVLKEAIYKTDVIRADKPDCGCELYLKAENLQKTGSFKLRGAYYKISQLSPEEKARGVVACSAGNHAQGVALAALRSGIPAVICLPEGAPISKVEATRSYGAEICLVPGVYDDAYNRALQLQKEHGYTFINPFDDEDVIAGQGTIGLEILSQIPDLDAIVVPVGGGGLVSGVAFAVKQVNPAIKVYGVQAEGAPSMFNSLKDGHIEALTAVSTVADGIAVKQPGERTYCYCRDFADEIVTVNDDEIATAILTLIENRCRGRGRDPARRRARRQAPRDKGQKGLLPYFGRQYRRYHIKPRDSAGFAHFGQTMHAQYRAARQAGAARRRIEDHRGVRRQRYGRSSRARARRQRRDRLLPPHRHGNEGLRAHRKYKGGTRQSWLPHLLKKET